MMRYTFSSGQFILLSLVIAIISTFFDCYEICENRGLATYSKLIFGNDSHEYSHYYYYFQTIRRNQPSPVVDEQFVKLAADEKIPLKFPFKFYGTNVSELKMYSSVNTGSLEMKIENGLGTIYTDLLKSGLPEYEISNEKEFVAVRMIFHRNIDGKSVELKVLNLIHPSGKISVYYENVSEEIRENELESVVNRHFLCQVGAPISAVIDVPRKWIKTKTLVEYEVAGDCPNHKSIKACRDAKILNTPCMWCEQGNMCITSNDNGTHNFKVNGCQNKSSIVDVSGEPALIEEKEETTPTISEADLRNEMRQTTENTETHLNVTTDTTEDEEQEKSRNYSYIIVPVVVTFIVVCIGCVIGLWFYRKKRSMP